MKKIINLFLFFTYISFSHSPMSEVKPLLIGTNFGVNNNSISTDKDTLSAESGFGYNLGIHFTYLLGYPHNSKSSITFYLEFMSRNNQINDIQNIIKYDLSNRYINLKTNYEFDLVQFSRSLIIIHSGPYFSYLMNSNITSESDVEIPEYDFQDFEFGLDFGLSYLRNFGNYNLSIDYNFMLGFTDALKERDFRYSSHNINLIYTLVIK